MSGAAQRVGRPSFAAVEAVFPHPLVVGRPTLYEELGISALVNNPAYENTCAIRMSYALIKAGMTLRKGGLKINKGPHQGQRIEPSMRKLAEHLVELWGAPEKFDSDTAAGQALSMKRGVAVFFFGEFLPLVRAQGHIDLLRPKPTGFMSCVGTCFFGPHNKVWFWALP